MKHWLMVQSLVVCLLALAHCGDAGASAGDNTLLLAHFNTGLAPEYCRGEQTIGGRLAEITGGRRGMPFKNSLPAPEAVNLNIGRSSWLSYPVKGNVSPDEGTVQFWICPEWKRVPRSPACVFFRLFFGDGEDRMSLPGGGDRFYIYKSENLEFLRLCHNGGYVSADIGNWECNSWHQVGVTWKPGEVALYVDGRAAGSGRYRKPEKEPQEIILGSPYYGHAAVSLIDELRILSRAQSPEEMLQDYLRQVRGTEFRIVNEEKTDIDGEEIFRPVTPKKVERKSALINECINAHYTTERMTVDGILDEKAWADAQEITGFKKHGAKPEDPAVAAQSFVKVLYDNRFIYFGARFIEPNMAQLQAKHDQRDLAIDGDDSLEIVFDTRNSPATFYHFVGNLIGGIYDSCGGDKNWSAYHSVGKGAKGKNEWTMEMAISFADLGVSRPILGEVWGLRLCRERKPDGGENTSWPATSFPFFARNDLAKLVFLGKAGEKTQVEVVSQSATFSFGMNSPAVAIADLTGKAQKLTLSATLLGDNNSVLDVIEAPGTLPANGKIVLTLEIPVRSDNIALIALTVNDAGGNPLWGRQLQPAFALSALRLCDAAAALPDMRGDMNYLAKSKHTVCTGIRKSVEHLETCLRDFDAKVNAAIGEKRLLAADEWEAMRGVLAGFTEWRANRDFLVWETDPWQDGTPYDMPEKASDVPTLSFEQAGNEREVRAICLHGLLVNGRKDVRLVPSFLVKAGNDQDKINSKLSYLERTRLYVPARKVRVYHSPYLRDGARRLRADALLESPANIVALSPGKTEKYWIVFDSKDVPPGEYVGSITIKPADTEESDRATWRKIPLKITVWDFALPETKDWPLDCFLFFGSSLVAANEPVILRLLHDYHINWCMTVYQQYIVGMVETITGSYGGSGYMGRAMDWGGYDALAKAHPDCKTKVGGAVYDEAYIARQDVFLREAKRLGMKVMFAWGCCKNIEWQLKMRNHLFSLGYTYDDYALQGMGDEFLAAVLEQPHNLPFHRLMYAADPRVQFMVTLTSVPPPAGCTYEQLDEVAKYCKIWFRYCTRAWPPEQERAKQDLEFFAKHDTKFWTYQCAQQMQNWPALDYYRLYPIRGVLMGSDGIAYWTFNSNKGDPFDHGDGHDDGITYLDPKDNSPVPTVRLEALRDGLEDAAYMRLLKNLIAAAKQADPQRDLTAYETLITIKARAMHDAKSWQQLYAWRKELAKAILLLAGKREPKPAL